MPGVPFFVPAPVVDQRGYSPFARRSSASSLPRRPTSASSTSKAPLAPRPSSAKPLQRPQSAKSGHPGSKSVDYMGVSNMIKSLNFKTSRKWREKSPDASDKGKGCRPQSPPRSRVVAWKDKNEDEQSETEKKIETVQKNIAKNSRRNRSSHFTKFKYPQQYHYGSSASHVNYLERNIPQCLRRGPRYANQPMRQNCNFNPVNSMTHLKWHSIRSNSLPGYKGPAVPKPPSVAASEPDVRKTEDVSGDHDEWSDGPHTGSFEYVYKGKGEDDRQLFFDAQDDEGYDEVNNNQAPQEAVISVLNSEGESDADSVTEEEPTSVSKHPGPPLPEVAEDIEEEIPDYMDSDKPPETGLFKSSVSRESEGATSYLDYQDYEAEIPEERDERDNQSVVESIKSSKSAHSVKSTSSKSSKKNSRKSSRSSIKYSDADIDEILGSDDNNDLLDEYMSSLQTPRTPSEGRFSRMGGEEISRDSKFRKTVRIHDELRDEDLLNDDIPEDKDSNAGSVDSYDIGNLPSLSTLGMSSATPRRVVRPMTAMRRNLEEDDGF